MQHRKIKEEIFTTIDEIKEEAIDTLLELLNYKSVNHQYDGDEKEAQKWFNKMLLEIGFETEMFDVDPEKLSDYDYFVEPMDRNYKNRPNVAGILRGEGKGNSLVLNGHIDVVPIGREKTWNYSPWGEMDDNKIYGRGSSDMKGGLIAMYMAVKIINELDIALKGDIIFQSVIDEESSGNGTLMCIAKGYTGDAGIVAECTDLEMKIAHRGVQFLRVKTSGKSGHAAQRQQLVNANDKMMIIYNNLLECEKNERLTKKHPLLSSPTISVGMIKGGDAPHIVPDECEINCDVKYLPSEEGKKVREIVNKYIKDAATQDKWLKSYPPEIKWLLDADPSAIPKDEDIIKNLTNTFTEVTEEKPIFSGLQGCADMRHLIKRGETPSLLFGPGNIDTAHKPNEFIEVNKFLLSIKIYAAFILDWCGVK